MPIYEAIAKYPSWGEGTVRWWENAKPVISLQPGTQIFFYPPSFLQLIVGPNKGETHSFQAAGFWRRK